MHSETQTRSLQIIRMLLPTWCGGRDGGGARGSAPTEEGCDSRAGVQQGALAAGRPGSGAAAQTRLGLPGGRLERGLLRRRASELRRALLLAREQLGFTAACRAAVTSAAHTSKQEASRHLVADL